MAKQAGVQVSSVIYFSKKKAIAEDPHSNVLASLQFTHLTRSKLEPMIQAATIPISTWTQVHAAF